MVYGSVEKQRVRRTTNYPFFRKNVKTFLYLRLSMDKIIQKFGRRWNKSGNNNKQDAINATPRKTSWGYAKHDQKEACSKDSPLARHRGSTKPLSTPYEAFQTPTSSTNENIPYYSAIVMTTFVF